MSDICYVAYGNRDLNQFGDVDAIKKALNYYGVATTSGLVKPSMVGPLLEKLATTSSLTSTVPLSSTAPTVIIYGRFAESPPQTF